MKHYAPLVLVILLLIFLPTNGFAGDFSISAGAGGLAGYTFTRYTLAGENITSIQRMDRFDYAGFLFFDATYAEFSVMFKGGSNSYAENVASGLIDSKGTGTETSIGLSLLGKYPFTINESIAWFPLFGLEYQIALSQKRQPDGNLVYDRSKGELAEDKDIHENPYPLSAWNSFWVDIGAGLDCTISGPLFIRGELLFGFRLPTGYELGALEFAKKQMKISDPKLAGLTGSPTVKLAIGYRF